MSQLSKKQKPSVSAAESPGKIGRKRVSQATARRKKYETSRTAQPSDRYAYPASPRESRPENASASGGRSSVGRADVGRRRDAGSTRRTYWPDMNLPLYSPDRAGGGLEAGMRPVVAARPFPHVAEGLREHSVGRRLAQRKADAARRSRRNFRCAARRARDFPFGFGGRRASAQRANASARRSSRGRRRVAVHGHFPVEREDLPRARRDAPSTAAPPSRAVTASTPREHSSARR